MALGDPHVMALLASLDHLPSLTSIDVSDNRFVESRPSRKAGNDWRPEDGSAVDGSGGGASEATLTSMSLQQEGPLFTAK